MTPDALESENNQRFFVYLQMYLATINTVYFAYVTHTWIRLLLEDAVFVYRGWVAHRNVWNVVIVGMEKGEL